MAPLTILIAYLLGSIPFGYLIVKWRRGADVRAAGSGATGATNVMRSAGRGAAIVTLLLDALKGYLAVTLARALTGAGAEVTWTVAAAACAAIIGHIFPVWLGFRAGKGVATGLGVFLALAPGVVIASLAIFLLAVALTRYISLGSILAAAAAPLWAWLWYGRSGTRADLAPLMAALASSAALIIAKHAANIRRLLSGTEHKLGAR
jgi:glycerol-3-phosphate acyltransferase PlsY